MSKYLLCESSSGYDIVTEGGLLKGPAAANANVDYKDRMGVRVSGMVIAVDLRKKILIEEMVRRGGEVPEMSDGEESDGSLSSIYNRTRSRVSSTSSIGTTAEPVSKKRTSMVGKAPLMKGPSAVPAFTPKRSAAAPYSKKPTRVARASRSMGSVVAAPAATPLRAPTPFVSRIGASASSSLSTPVSVPPASSPLVPPSLLPPGFSPSGTVPLVLPTTNDDHSFRQFMMQAMISMHSEITGVKAMVNNMFLGWNHLIVQSANRSTSTHQEVRGTKDRLDEVSTVVKKVETTIQEVSAKMGETTEFNYEPFSTKERIDEIDKQQVLTVLATDIEGEIYDNTDPDDLIDLTRPLNKRDNTAKAKWLLEAVLHRRMVSSGEHRILAQRSVIERINNYAAKRRRVSEAVDSVDWRDYRLSTKGKGRRIASKRSIPAEVDDMGISAEREPTTNHSQVHENEESMQSDHSEFSV